MNAEKASETGPSQRMPIRTGAWLTIEDERLREAMAEHGSRWTLVSRDVGSRTGDQCAKRWNENLDPKLDHSAWSSKEELDLLDHVNLYGHNWKFIADNFFEARAPLTLKNRFSMLKRRLKREGSSRQHSPYGYPCDSPGSSPFDPCWYPSSGTSTPSGGGTSEPMAQPMDNQTYFMPMPAYGPLDFMPSATSSPMPMTRSQDASWSHDPFVSAFEGKKDAVGTEYSVTTQRSRLRTAVSHLVDAAMAEDVEGAGESDLVTFSITISMR